MKGLRLLTIALTLFITSPAMAEMIWGELTSFSTEKGYITVKTEVQGLTGPEKRNISYKIDENTLISLCLEGTCNEGMALTSLERLKEFDYFVAENISITGREVQLQYGKDTARLEAINIFAPAPTYYFTPVDFISTF